MKKLLIVGLCMVGFVSNAQKQIEAKELSRKEIRALVKAEKKKKAN